MSDDRFGLSDLRFYAYHGAAPHERVVGQWFSADIELSLDLGPAGDSDDLGATVDYRDVAAVVLEAATGEPAALIERVASRIATRVLDRFPASEVRVRLRKFSSPGPSVAATTWIEVVRTRRPAA